MTCIQHVIRIHPINGKSRCLFLSSPFSLSFIFKLKIVLNSDCTYVLLSYKKLGILTKVFKELDFQMGLIRKSREN